MKGAHAPAGAMLFIWATSTGTADDDDGAPQLSSSISAFFALGSGTLPACSRAIRS